MMPKSRHALGLKLESEVTQAVYLQFELFHSAAEMCQAASVGDMDYLSMLVENGVDVNEADYDSRTALHLAASTGQKAICEYLCIDPYIDVNAADRLGKWMVLPKQGFSCTVHEFIAKIRQ